MRLLRSLVSGSLSARPGLWIAGLGQQLLSLAQKLLTRLGSLQICALAETFAVVCVGEPQKGCARSKQDPEGVDPKFQCSPLSQAKKNLSDSNQTPKSLLPTLFRCYVQRNWGYSGETNWLRVGAPADSPQNQTLWSRLSFLSKLQDKCWYFYSRLRSLLACGLCTASGSSLSVACGLLVEVYIQPRPPSSPASSWSQCVDEVNETAPRREGGGRREEGGRERVRGKTRVCVCV